MSVIRTLVGIGVSLATVAAVAVADDWPQWGGMTVFPTPDCTGSGNVYGLAYSSRSRPDGELEYYPSALMTPGGSALLGMPMEGVIAGGQPMLCFEELTHTCGGGGGGGGGAYQLSYTREKRLASVTISSGEVLPLEEVSFTYGRRGQLESIGHSCGGEPRELYELSAYPDNCPTPARERPGRMKYTNLTTGETCQTDCTYDEWGRLTSLRYQEREEGGAARRGYVVTMGYGGGGGGAGGGAGPVSLSDGVDNDCDGIIDQPAHTCTLYYTPEKKLERIHDAVRGLDILTRGGSTSPHKEWIEVIDEHGTLTRLEVAKEPDGRMAAATVDGMPFATVAGTIPAGGPSALHNWWGGDPDVPPGSICLYQAELPPVEPKKKEYATLAVCDANGTLAATMTGRVLSMCVNKEEEEEVMGGGEAPLEKKHRDRPLGLQVGPGGGTTMESAFIIDGPPGTLGDRMARLVIDQDGRVCVGMAHTCGGGGGSGAYNRWNFYESWTSNYVVPTEIEDHYTLRGNDEAEAWPCNIPIISQDGRVLGTITSDGVWTAVLPDENNHPAALVQMNETSAPPRLTFNVATGRLTMDTRDANLNGFILHSPSGQFTGAAVPPTGFVFQDSNTTTIWAQVLPPGGSPFSGVHDFGHTCVDRKRMWNPVTARYEWDWDYTCTLEGMAGIYVGDVEIISALPGDTDLDNDCDAWDIQRILAANSLNHGAGRSWQEGDFNGDGLVTWEDIQMILDHGQYGREMEGPLMALIPEPATLALLSLGALAVLRRRRR